MNALTGRQKEILNFLLDYSRSNGYPPTIREIRQAFRLKSNRGVVDHLRALEKKGYIRRDHKSSRAIEILSIEDNDYDSGVPSAERTFRCPVAGRIAAGEPEPPIEDKTESLLLDIGLFREKGDFMLEVEGDSMIDDHIVPGDMIVVKRVRSCESGDLVVAMVDGEATVKRYFREGGRVVLRPANRYREPIVFTGDDPRACTIIGRVVGVIRRFA